MKMRFPTFVLCANGWNSVNISGETAKIITWSSDAKIFVTDL